MSRKGIVRLLTLFLLLLPFFTYSQTAPATYWVQFIDKAANGFDITQPETFLSQRAVDRRVRQGIAIDSLDLPVSETYVNTLLAAGNIELIHKSKWFNAVTIRSTDTLALDTLHLLPFVAQVKSSGKRGKVTPVGMEKFGSFPKQEIGGHYNSIYGPSFRQVSMMNGHLLHDMNAKGQGMLIGVLDSGFEHADSLDVFKVLREESRIVFTRDLAEKEQDVYDDHWHGMSVLSTMTGELPGQLMGTATEANYALFRTEFTDSENIWEEDNWVAGAELADSLGCDILNTSLGYTTFDDSTLDHTHADLDGMTTRISIAAGIASDKGMIPVQSAGNSGQSEWYRISAAADAFDILAVGAVKSDRSVAGFSSRGPSADGRVKPDVAAMGEATVGMGPWGPDPIMINGTSFSSPITAGLVACLWQLHPDKTNLEVMDAVRRSASQFTQPDDDLGYGIPDFYRAHRLLAGEDLTGFIAPTIINTFPSPFTDHLTLEFFSANADSLELEVFDMMGRRVFETAATIDPGTYQRMRVTAPQLSTLKEGMYILRAYMGGITLVARTLKQ